MFTNGQMLSKITATATYIGGNVQALIDPGLTGYVPDLLNQMSADGIKKEDIRYVINTHSHPDHFQGSEVFDQEKVKVGLHTKEIEFLKGAGGELYSLFGINVPQDECKFSAGRRRCGFRRSDI